MSLLLAALLSATPAPAADPCEGRGTAILVKAEQRRLSLCEEGRRSAVHRVALGQGGFDKRREGDAKLPLGEYALGAAIPSKAYHLFLPVGYPTQRQRRAGYTGGAIGVHGPARGYEGPLSTTVDWTLGCIAVGTDEEIEGIARWVKAKRVQRIVIELR